MTIKCECDICGKVGTAIIENPIPNGWLFINIATSINYSISQARYLLCEECKTVIEDDMNEHLVKNMGYPRQCDSCKHMNIESDSSDDGMLSVVIEECECADDPRMESVAPYELALAPEERGECPCFEPRGSAE